MGATRYRRCEGCGKRFLAGAATRCQACRPPIAPQDYAYMAAWGGRGLAPPVSAFPEALSPAELTAALSPADAAYMSAVVGGRSPCRWQLLDADRAVVVQWNLTPDDEAGARCFFHITMPGARYIPWHDHGFDNTSVVISGGYDELWKPSYWCDDKPIVRRFRKGDMIFRNAREAHRLVLPPDIPYTMTLFMTGGPKDSPPPDDDTARRITLAMAADTSPAVVQ